MSLDHLYGSHAGLSMVERVNTATLKRRFEYRSFEKDFRGWASFENTFEKTLSRNHIQIFY